RPPRSTPFPYTTLFRSCHVAPPPGHSSPSPRKPNRATIPASPMPQREETQAPSCLPILSMAIAAELLHCEPGPASDPILSRSIRSEEHTSELQSRSDLV